MNQIIAKNIISLRGQRGWTQEHLAIVASLNVRSIQRAEEGRGVSAETLLAIASAFDTSVANVRLDREALQSLAAALGLNIEEVGKKLNEFQAKYEQVPLTIVTRSADLECIFGNQLYHFGSDVKDEAPQDAFAELKQYVSEVGDLDLQPIQQRDALKDVLALVQQLNELGVAISVGVGRHRMRLGRTPPSLWSVLYVIAAPIDEAKTFAVVEKTAMKIA